MFTFRIRFCRKSVKRADVNWTKNPVLRKPVVDHKDCRGYEQGYPQKYFSPARFFVAFTVLNGHFWCFAMVFRKKDRCFRVRSNQKCVAELFKNRKVRRRAEKIKKRPSGFKSDWVGFFGKDICLQKFSRCFCMNLIEIYICSRDS